MRHVINVIYFSPEPLSLTVNLHSLSGAGTYYVRLQTMRNLEAIRDALAVALSYWLPPDSPELD
jgi:hypothetical protein